MLADGKHIQLKCVLFFNDVLVYFVIISVLRLNTELKLIFGFQDDGENDKQSIGMPLDNTTDGIIMFSVCMFSLPAGTFSG